MPPDDGEMGTPVPRGYCVRFWQEPILAKIRHTGRKMGEFVYLFVYLAGVEWRKFRAARGAMWPPGKKREESHHSEGRLNQAWKT
jgi:hypothetical protein